MLIIKIALINGRIRLVKRSSGSRTLCDLFRDLHAHDCNVGSLLPHPCQSREFRMSQLEILYETVSVTVQQSLAIQDQLDSSS